LRKAARVQTPAVLQHVAPAEEAEHSLRARMLEQGTIKTSGRWRDNFLTSEAAPQTSEM
jgi:hypothetical protein